MADIAVPTTPLLSTAKGAVIRSYLAAVAIDAGEFVVLNSSGTLILADRDADSVYAWLALNDAAVGGPVDVVIVGPVDGFAGMTPGTVYYLSDTGGTMCPLADVGAGENFVVVGIAETATRLMVANGYATQLPNDTVVSTSPAQGQILYYNGTAWANLAVGTDEMVLITQGAAADPVWAVKPFYMAIPVVTAVSLTGINMGGFTVPTGYTLRVDEVQVWARGVTAAITVDVKEADTTILTAPVTPVADTVTDGSVADASIAADAEVNVTITTDGTGAATNLLVVIIGELLAA